MIDLHQDKNFDDQLSSEIKRCLDTLAQNTVITQKEAKEFGRTKASGGSDNKLSAHRICQIENRLANDRSLKFPTDEEYIISPEKVPAAIVKKKLCKTYQRIKKSSNEFSAQTNRQLDD